MNFSLTELLGVPWRLEHWRDAQLPQSRTAVENAIIMDVSPLWVLLYDPQVMSHGMATSLVMI